MRLVGFTRGTHDVYDKTLKACRMGFFALVFLATGSAFAVEPIMGATPFKPQPDVSILNGTDYGCHAL